MSNKVEVLLNDGQKADVKVIERVMKILKNFEGNNEYGVLAALENISKTGYQHVDTDKYSVDNEPDFKITPAVLEKLEQTGLLIKEEKPIDAETTGFFNISGSIEVPTYSIHPTAKPVIDNAISIADSMFMSEVQSPSQEYEKLVEQAAKQWKGRTS